ncbi:MAG: hypothetical protein DRZ82_00325 [Thermoprotei archaeon]|nr:MAG: hypothetical protein DRZ82_00325 [Thermoprotei archaeon]
MARVKWLSKTKVRWFVARHGSKFVYVELKGTIRNNVPLIIRTIKVVEKGGNVESVYTEFYDLSSAREILEAEKQIISLMSSLSDNNARSSEAVLSHVISELDNISSKVVYLRDLLEELVEVMGSGKGESK